MFIYCFPADKCERVLNYANIFSTGKLYQKRKAFPNNYHKGELYDY